MLIIAMPHGVKKGGLHDGAAFNKHTAAKAAASD